MLIGTIDFYQFITFSDLDLDYGSQGQTKAKPDLLILTHFSSDWKEIWYVDEAIQAEHPKTTFELDLSNKKNKKN